MKSRTTWMCLCLFIAACVSGCALESARDFGESCENPSFIWTSGKIIRQEDGNLDYAVNFRHGLCPVNAQYCMMLKGDIVGDVLESNINYCSDKREACPEDSHLFEGKCERDSALHCGSNEMNCLDREKGVAEAECVKDTYGNKACKATRCLDTFALLNGACKSGGECCGDYCMDCTRIPPQVKCYAESLNSASMTCGEKCPTHAPDECNGVCIDSMTNESFCGSDNCELRYCADIVEGWRNGICLQGKCKVSDCLVGYHMLRNADGNTCEKDTTEVCGDYKIDCTHIANAVSVECRGGDCIVHKCREGFEINNGQCLPVQVEKCGNTPCEPHQVCNAATNTCECDENYTECNGVCYDLSTDRLHCGSCSNECHIAHAEVKCENSECLFVRCNDGYEFNDTNARCEFTGRCASGFVYNHDTSRCEASDRGCEQGQIDCNGDGLVCCDCNGACDGDKCDNAVCDPVVSCEDGSGCVSSCCIENICVARSQCGSTIDCGQHAHVYGDGCEPDSVENCGEHGKACNVPNADNDCIAGACTFECIDGYHQVNDSCIQNDCTDGQKFCTNKDNIGEVSTCIGGVLGVALPCRSVSCNSDNDCGICKNGDRQCDGATPQICTNGAWKDESACSAPEHGVAVCSGKGVCSYTCDNGYTDNGKVCCKKVSNGKITVNNSSTCSFTCNNGYHESSSGCVSDDCTDGETQCSGRVPQTCSGGVWTGSAECASDKICSGGSCTACASGKHVYDNTCEDNSVTNCGTHGNTCTAPTNGTATCSSGTCGFTCPSSYTKTNTECIPNDVYCATNGAKQCSGQTPQVCTNNRWTNSTECSSTQICSGGNCVACGSNQVASGNTCVCKANYCDVSGTCVNNDASHCYGASTQCGACPAPANGTATCSNGTCGKTCDNLSYPTLCGDACVNTNTNSSYCGSCSNSCTKPSNASSVSCVSGSCVPTCNSDYHVYGTSCEQDTVTNCGSHGNSCTAPTNGVATCNNGTCEKSCNNSSYPTLCGDTCVNTNTNSSYCGSCSNSCTKPSNASSVSCVSGSCVPTCNSGYHAYNSQCEADSPTNCGTHGLSCGTNGICKQGICSTCGLKYHVWNNSCEENDRNNCGSHNAKCGTYQSCCPKTNGGYSCQGGDSPPIPQCALF